MYESRTTYVSHELVAFAYLANHLESYDVYMREMTLGESRRVYERDDTGRVTTCI